MGEMYTERLLDHYRRPRNKGTLSKAAETVETAGQAKLLTQEQYNPLCGDRVTLEFLIQDERVIQARFDGRGCALCLGAASILTEVVQGKSLDELQDLDKDTFLAELESEVRPARLKCALLPWKALRQALFGDDSYLD